MSEIGGVEEYIASFPPAVKSQLNEMRRIVKGVVPEAEERISYQIIGYFRSGGLVHIGGFKNHVSLFPGASLIKRFAHKLKSYRIAKGTVQFPLDQPLPTKLIERLVQARVAAKEAGQG